jgi:hypothetical protein
MRQDAKQDIRGFSAKNFDFICHDQKGERAFLIDVKGSSDPTEDTKVQSEDLDTLKMLQKIYGPNVKGLLVFLWLKKTGRKADLFKQTFRIKALTVDEYDKKKRITKWGNRNFFRCSKEDLKEIWDYLPELQF